MKLVGMERLLQLLEPKQNCKKAYQLQFVNVSNILQQFLGYNFNAVGHQTRNKTHQVAFTQVWKIYSPLGVQVQWASEKVKCRLDETMPFNLSLSGRVISMHVYAITKLPVPKDILVRI